MIVYIAGPMTGYPEWNYPLFNEVAAALRKRGYAVHNPAENFGGNPNLERRVYLRAAIHQVLQSQIIAHLPGWEDSEGAKLEIRLAEELQLDVVPAEKLLVTTPERYAYV